MTEIKTEVAKTIKAFSVKNKPHIKSISPFKNRYEPTIENKQKGIYDYGRKNNLPNRLLEWVLDSGTAKLAQAKRATYIAADGFQEDEAAKFMVNDKQTADDLLGELAGYMSYFKGAALWVKRDGNGVIKSVSVLPLQDIRKKLDGNYTYNPTLSAKKFEKDKDKTIHRFLGAQPLTEMQLQGVGANGELLYIYKPTADNKHYPIPDYYAAIEDVRTSSELQKFDLETVYNAFITSAILTIFGDYDNQTEDDRGMTAQDYLDEQLKQFTGDGKDGDGVSGRNKLLVMTARTPDEAPKLQPFDSKVILEASNTKRDIIDRAVCRAFGVNPALVGFADAAILGNQQALANASDELSKNVWAEQAMISAAFKALFPEMDWTITSFRPIQYIPTELLKDLTASERRALIGYPELEQEANTDTKTLAELLGVDGTQSLTAVLADPAISDAQKVQIMQILFGLTPEQSNSLVYGSEGGATT